MFFLNMRICQAQLSQKIIRRSKRLESPLYRWFCEVGPSYSGQDGRDVTRYNYQSQK